MAIGAEDGEGEIHVAANSVSSSMLIMLDTHLRAAPASRYIGTERVPMRRLDSIASDYLGSCSVPFLKIDTQGYEDRILLGATKTLNRFIVVELELSLVPLYEGQRLIDDLRNYLIDNGFQLWAMWPEFVDAKNGRLLQVNATFVRD